MLDGGTSMNKISLQEVLDLQYLEKWRWSPDGRYLAYLLDDGGVADLWCVEPGSGRTTQLSDAEHGVSDFSWHPTGGELLYAQDGNLHRVILDGELFDVDEITRSNRKIQSPTYSPSGEHFGFICEGDLWIHSNISGSTYSLSLPKGNVMPGAFGLQEGLCWSPEGTKVLFRFRDEEKILHVGVASSEGQLLWRTTGLAELSAGVDWLDDRRFLFAVSKQQPTVRTFHIATLPEHVQRVHAEIAACNNIAVPSVVDVQVEDVYRQEAKGTPGALRVSGAWPEPAGERILFLTEDDGWAHLYLYDPSDKGELEQLTFGECEDFGHMGDTPCWAPGGHYVCYSSNRTGSGRRQLWLLDVDERTNYQLTELPGTSVQPQWSPNCEGRLAFLHCDEHRSADLWVMDFAPGEVNDDLQLSEGADTLRVLTQTKPETWTDEKDIIPQEVTFEGAEDWKIHGYLFTPPGAGEDEVTYPAVVWVHGGPIRQMREGFHPSRPYALFYAFSQYLAHRGYATLMVNFRGGIGYGREFRNGIYGKMGVDDIKDVVGAGRYLKELPYIDAARVGVWGLSYGGYMTLTALTKYPDEFRMGINLAGIWDFAQWMHWIHAKHGRHMGGFEVYFKGSPEQNPELYRVGSPCTYKDNLKRPLINLHGTADANVDFAQMDRIVKDCVDLGCDYEAYYYPDEAHAFVLRSTWADAFGKIEREFDKYLKG